jgi:signal transduction histidine kinase
MQEFIGDAAHELRTPMTVVKGYAELLKGKQLDQSVRALPLIDSTVS